MPEAELPPERPSALDATFSAGADVLAGEMGALIAGPYGLLAAALPSALQYALQGLRYSVSKRSQNRLLAAAAEELGTDEQGLGDAVRLAGEDALPLALEVLEAAARTTNEQKIDALARVWVHGIGPDAILDQDVLMVRVLAQLEVPYVRVLALMTEGPVQWSAAVEQLPDVAVLLPLAFGSLEQLGLIEEAPSEHRNTFLGPGVRPRYQLTDWGSLALSYLEGRNRVGLPE